MTIDQSMMSLASCIDLGSLYPAEEIKGSQTRHFTSEKVKGYSPHGYNYTRAIEKVLI